MEPSDPLSGTVKDPTAQTSVGDSAATELSPTACAPLGFGAGTTDQFEPSQCMVRTLETPKSG